MQNFYVENLSVSFDGFKALDIGSFGLERRELRVVIGPNGAGKTTLLDVICGRTKPDSGHVFFRNLDLTKMAEDEIVATGVGRKFQTPSVFTSLSVFENLMLASKNKRGVFASLWHRISAEERGRIGAVAERTGLADILDDKAGSLAHGQKQWLEIAMVLLLEPELFLIDEPAAGMTDEETHRTGELLLDLARERSVIVIEHDMTFVRQIASTVTVLHEGRVLVEGPMEQVENDPRVIECYLGSAPDASEKDTSRKCNSDKQEQGVA